VISDVMMPVMDGVTLLKAMREVDQLRAAYFILLTAKDRTADMVTGFAATADDYITKPFRMAELSARVLAGARLKRAHDRLRQTNARLQQVLRQRALLLGIAAHDIRNPVNIITTYISLLGQGVMSSEELKEVCVRRAGELIRIIDNLLDMSKIDAGHVELVPSEVDVQKVVRDASALCVPVAQQQRVSLTSACPVGVRCLCDEQRVRDMATTIILSAIHLAEGGGKVDITLGTASGSVNLVVTSSGGGCQPEDTARILSLPTEHGRIPAGYTTSILIELALVRRLAALMGGEVWAESSGPEHGIRFEVRIPAPPGETEAAARARYASILAAQDGWGGLDSETAG